MLNIIKAIGMWLFGMGIVFSTCFLLIDDIPLLYNFLSGFTVGVGAVLSAWEND